MIAVHQNHPVVCDIRDWVSHSYTAVHNKIAVPFWDRVAKPIYRKLKPLPKKILKLAHNFKSNEAGFVKTFLVALNILQYQRYCTGAAPNKKLEAFLDSANLIYFFGIFHLPKNLSEVWLVEKDNMANLEDTIELVWEKQKDNATWKTKENRINGIKTKLTKGLITVLSEREAQEIMDYAQSNGSDLKEAKKAADKIKKSASDKIKNKAKNMVEELISETLDKGHSYATVSRCKKAMKKHLIGKQDLKSNEAKKIIEAIEIKSKNRGLIFHAEKKLAATGSKAGFSINWSTCTFSHNYKEIDGSLHHVEYSIVPLKQTINFSKNLFWGFFSLDSVQTISFTLVDIGSVLLFARDWGVDFSRIGEKIGQLPLMDFVKQFDLLVGIRAALILGYGCKATSASLNLIGLGEELSTTGEKLNTLMDIFVSSSEIVLNVAAIAGVDHGILLLGTIATKSIGVVGAFVEVAAA